MEDLEDPKDMNKLEKFFATLNTAQSRMLKSYTTDELTSQIREYVDFTPYILKQTYRLLCGQESEDRKNGARILKSLMFQFRLVTDFRIEYGETGNVYLGSAGDQFNAAAPSVQEQRRMVKKIAKLEHVEANFLSDIDFKAGSGEAIKKHKVEERQIENVVDFFEQITSNLLSYEWYKRHGAFLAFAAMFSCRAEGEMQIRVDPKLFSKIYEILVTDKFNDFVDDRTVAPVRDAAAYLLSCIYPLLGPNCIIEQLISFLDSSDWQVQFSGLIALGYLKGYVSSPETLCTKLVSLLGSCDEDIKLLSAELLCYFPLVVETSEILSRCWKNIESEEAISVSKTSNLSLLGKIYKEDPSLTIPQETLKEVFPCFTSPVPEVRVSVLRMVENFRDESIDFLVAEMVLVEEKEEIREMAMEYLRRHKGLSRNLVTHFLHVIGGSLYEPYREEDFVSYEELYFTRSGIRVVGKEEILKNRCRLFECIMRSPCDMKEGEGTMVGRTFLCLYESMQSLMHGGVERCRDVRELEFYFKECRDLKAAPMKEFKRKMSSPGVSSMHPMVDPLYVDYTRMVACMMFPSLGECVPLYGVETCRAFLELFSRIVVEHYDAGRVDVDSFVECAYRRLVDGEDGFLSFFEAFDQRLLAHPFFSRIKEFEDRLGFFARTIHIYAKDTQFSRLEFLFDEALSKRNTVVLRGLMASLEFNERFVREMLSRLDVELVDAVLEHGDHSFNPLFIKPLIRNISNNTEREGSSRVFSKIIPTLNFRTNSRISRDLVEMIEEEKRSFESLLDVRKMAEYNVRCPTTIKLRDYQVEGVKWLNFLYSFNLNGILADDMGLGKTLQVLTFLCSEMYETDRKVLVICPSSLTGHWKAEVKKFFPCVRAEVYRKELKSGYDMLVCSYESFRNDYVNFVDRDWFYVVVDEGHVLRNRQTMLYSRMNMIRCPHKIVLTGTPVHNSVEDLVSLFNFLMPNYLGNEKGYGGLHAKMSDTEIEKAQEKLDVLHKKVLPFILRRLKIDVLKDLPPKIIRDVNVEFGPEQEELYSEISERGGMMDGTDVSEFEYGKVNAKSTGLKRTRELLLAASHIGHFKESSETSCKVRALEDVISLCGGEELRNKILVFFQFKTTIDLVVKDIMSRHKIKYSRLDGSVPGSVRSKVAEEFNTGTTQMLFLTTQVGGLGLNLTGADTVVLYEHDWNPFNDLQAMDRAHRIGQKKTVNVFRLIAKNTLEERVMNLQVFKLFVANSLVSQQNADIETMDTKDLLERFQSLG